MTFPSRRLSLWPSWLRCHVAGLILVIGLHSMAWPDAAKASDDEGQDMVPVPKAKLELRHGKATVRLYEPDEKPPRAICVFGSGDGGWSPWEDVVSHWMRDAGIYVVGFDLRAYARGDFDAATLGQDMAALASDAAARCDGGQSPVVYGGWSMGAVQAVAAAGWKGRPEKLVGLLLLAADSRGRYGLRTSDELGMTPKGPGTFALSEFTPAMANLRVAQFHGGADFMASTAWIRMLKSSHQLYEVPGANHGFDGPDDSFQPLLLRGLDWVLGDETAGAQPPHPGLPFGLSPLWPAAALAMGLAVFFLASRRHSVRVLSWAVTTMGWVNLLEAILVKPPGVIAWMEQWLPLGVSEKSRILLLLSGLVLLFLARGLRRHKRLAWLVALIMLGASVVLHLSRAFDWHHAVAAAVLLVPLIRWRAEFVAQSDASSLRLAWIMAPVLALTLFVYGAIGLHQYSELGYFGEALTWGECAEGSVAALFAQKSEFDRDGGRAVRGFLANLRGGGLLGGLLVVLLLLRPVLARRMPLATEEERDRLRRLIELRGDDPMSGFALLPDKRCFFTGEGDQEAVVAYSLWRKFAVVLADPICTPSARPHAIREFSAFCKRQDWEPVFYCSHVSYRGLYEEAGFITFKVGEDARLTVADFRLDGGRFQNLRTARNKARKAGLEFQWYEASTGIDHGLEAQLQVISQQWLAQKTGGEMTFDLGSFSIVGLREHGAAIVRNPEGRIETFSTWLPYAQGRGRCLDIMRGRNEFRDVMDFLIVETIDHFKELGVEEVSLGNAPLANVDAEGPLESRQERAVKFLFDNFDQIYGYKRLFDFKRKYQPQWQGRYLAYRPQVPLAMVGLAVAGVHLPRGFIGLLRS